MAKPDSQGIRQNKPLTDFSLALFNEDKNFAHLQIPTTLVSDRGGIHYVMSADDNMRNSARLRTSGAESPVDGYALSTSTYLCETYALAHDMDIDDLADQDEVLDLEEAAAEFLAHKHKLVWEKAFADDIMKASTWGGTDQAGVSGTPGANEFKQWNDSASTPAKNVLEWAKNIRTRTGRGPNYLFVGDAVDAALRANADVIDRCKYTGAGGNTNQITAAMLAAYFGVEKYVVSSATQNTALEGATAVQAQMVGKEALLCYLHERAAPRIPTAFLKRKWRNMPDSTDGLRVRSFTLDKEYSIRVDMHSNCTFDVVAAALGQYASAVVA